MDGTTFHIAGDSLVDYVLHPVFLRFLAISIVMFALLDQRPDLAVLGGWQLTFLWFVVGCVVLGWLTLWSPLITLALAKGWIRQCYTPVLLVPMVLCAELALQAVTLLFGGSPRGPDHIVQYAARDLAVVFLLDLMHCRFVIYAHPLAQVPEAGTIRQATAPLPDAPVHEPEPADLEAAGPDASVVDAASEGGMVQIGPAALPLGSILLIRTEDHYLGVTTRTGKALHRAKMADIAELHSSAYGMQINRSVWIAYSAIRDVVDAENRQVVVSLITGDEERVSKPRIFAFRQAHAKYLSGRAVQG